MAWYTIKGSCGHDFRKQLYGKIEGRESYVEWANDRLECPDCFQKRIEKERLEKSNQAKEEAKQENLPELIGSEKQVNWALTIRKEMLSKCYQLIEELIKDDADSEFVEYVKAKIKKRKEKTDSKFFIDNRDNNSFYYFNNLYQKYKELIKTQ